MELLTHPWLVLVLGVAALVACAVARAASLVFALVGLAFIAATVGVAVLGAFVTSIPF